MYTSTVYASADFRPSSGTVWSMEKSGKSTPQTSTPSLIDSDTRVGTSVPTLMIPASGVTPLGFMTSVGPDTASSADAGNGASRAAARNARAFLKDGRIIMRCLRTGGQLSHGGFARGHAGTLETSFCVQLPRQDLHVSASTSHHVAAVNSS